MHTALRSSSATRGHTSSRDSGNRAFRSSVGYAPQSTPHQRATFSPLARTTLAAIAAIERSPALQRGFDNRKSKTASHSDARIQPSKCHSSNSMRCLSVQPSRRDDEVHFPSKPGDKSPGYVSATRSANADACTTLAAIAAIERSPALQRGFDNRKSKTASRSDARIQPNK